MKGCKILIVTTNLQKIKQWGVFLTSQKLQVLVATQPKQAIGIIEEKKPEIIFWGLKSKPKLLQSNSSIPIVYLTEAIETKKDISPNSLFMESSPEELLKKIKTVLSKNKTVSKKSEELKTLLVVDDIEVNRRLIADMLSNTPLQILLSESGKKSIGILKKQKVDMVLLDIEMPEMNGWETMKKYTAMQLKIPIFALTAHADNDTHNKAKANGFTGLITKPVDAKLLINTIKKQLALTNEISAAKTDVASATKPTASKQTLIDLSGLERVTPNNPTLKQETTNKFLQNINTVLGYLNNSSTDYSANQVRRDVHALVNLMPYFCNKNAVLKSKLLESIIKSKGKSIKESIVPFKLLLENTEQQLKKIIVW
jgi:CheY-like chemotaxis protein